MPRKSGLITVLQFDERHVSALRCKRTAKGVHVVSFAQEQGNWSDDDNALSLALKKFARSQGIVHDDVFTVLPRHEMTIRILVLPSHDPDEIKGMVRLSATEHVPYAPSELVIDQCILQRLADGHARVLAVFAHRDTVERHVRILAHAGLEPQKILVSTACIASLLLATQGDIEERSALINLASGGIEVLIVKGSRLEYGRAAATVSDWKDLDAAESVQRELLEEVRTSLVVFRRESPEDHVIDRLYVSAEHGNPLPAMEILSKHFDMQVVAARHAAMLCGKSSSDVHSVPLVLLGGALIAQDRAQIEINLVPPSLIQARKRAENRKAWLTIGAMATILVFSLAGLYAVLVHARQQYIASLQNQIETLRTIADEVAVKQRNLTALQQRVDRSGTVLEVLSRITELAPEEGLNFIKVTYDSHKGVLLQGRAIDLAIVNRFANALRRSAQSEETWLREARQGKSTEVQERGETVQQFEIEIPFSQPSAAFDLRQEENHTE